MASFEMLKWSFMVEYSLIKPKKNVTWTWAWFIYKPLLCDTNFVADGT